MASFKPHCKYGSKCFRLNPQHLADFSHPAKSDSSSEIVNSQESSSLDEHLSPMKKKLKTEHTFNQEKLKFLSTPELTNKHDLSEMLNRSNSFPSTNTQISANLFKQSSDITEMKNKNQGFDFVSRECANFDKSPQASTSLEAYEADTSPDQDSPKSKIRPISNESSSTTSQWQNSKSHSFMFTTVDGIDDYFNEYPNAVSLKQLLSPSFGDLESALLFTYLIEIDWVMQQFPADKRHIPISLIAHINNSNEEKLLKQECCCFPKVSIVKPIMYIPYGVHHSKMLILFYREGMRIVITTANLIPRDWARKTQGVWISPYFPKQDKPILEKSEFQLDFIEYLKTYKKLEFNPIIQNIAQHEMNGVTVKLVASTPGYYKDNNITKYGHMRMRSILERFSTKMSHVTPDWPLVAQFSSIGSLGASPSNWLQAEFSRSLCQCTSHPPLALIYPTVENVRTSLEGYSAGNSIPYNSKNDAKQQYLHKLFHQWKSDKNGRSLAAPHIKTYMRCSPDYSSVAWVLLTSSNLSKAAWGALQKDNTQLMIRSYELGILFLPQEQVPPREMYQVNADNDDLSDYYNLRNQITLPVDIPPTPYTVNDEPWLVDKAYSKPDVYGNVRK